ncbi:uncharacterized protein BDR25DRAFT_395210 [Lindgomyces ingoldianus]|uniref:Uncharacterized protein n=1 Tax=Lindgomyces ingoldianus TaxID=673940 RepID=A0ACB6QLD2_9PLEO|nr:uncharacterized protein BDR25DRAFT_395210 [Lindgomyces ingoldianus]KAF2467393.1 hypothetical protein BDR25DRAFT_395210 [Lindgomyces ingoldianus]
MRFLTGPHSYRIWSLRNRAVVSVQLTSVSTQGLIISMTRGKDVQGPRAEAMYIRAGPTREEGARARALFSSSPHGTKAPWYNPVPNALPCGLFYIYHAQGFHDPSPLPETALCWGHYISGFVIILRRMLNGCLHHGLLLFCFKRVGHCFERAGICVSPPTSHSFSLLRVLGSVKEGHWPFPTSAKAFWLDPPHSGATPSTSLFSLPGSLPGLAIEGSELYPVCNQIVDKAEQRGDAFPQLLGFILIFHLPATARGSSCMFHGPSAIDFTFPSTSDSLRLQLLSECVAAFQSSQPAPLNGLTRGGNSLRPWSVWCFEIIAQVRSSPATPAQWTELRNILVEMQACRLRAKLYGRMRAGERALATTWPEDRPLNFPASLTLSAVASIVRNFAQHGDSSSDQRPLHMLFTAINHYATSTQLATFKTDAYTTFRRLHVARFARLPTRSLLSPSAERRFFIADCKALFRYTTFRDAPTPHAYYIPPAGSLLAEQTRLQQPRPSRIPRALQSSSYTPIPFHTSAPAFTEAISRNSSYLRCNGTESRLTRANSAMKTHTDRYQGDLVWTGTAGRKPARDFGKEDVREPLTIRQDAALCFETIVSAS